MQSARPIKNPPACDDRGLGFLTIESHIDWIQKIPLPFEFVECNVCYETYPTMSFGNKEPSNWPHELRGKWERKIAIADYRDLQLIFAKTLEDMRFDQGSIRKNKIRVKKIG